MGSIVFFFTAIDAVIHSAYTHHTDQKMQCNNGAGAASGEVHCYLNAVMMCLIVLHSTLERAAAHVCLQRWPPDARLPAERLNWSVATLKSAQQWSWGKATFPREGCTRRCTEDAVGAVQSEAHRGAIGQLPGPGAPWAAGVVGVVKIFWTKTQQLGLRHLLGDGEMKLWDGREDSSIY